MEFPVYRKYKNDRSYFKIIGSEELVELKLIGSGSYQLFHLQAKILPDRVFIGDLIDDYFDYCVEIDETIYNEKLHWCQQHLKQV